MAAQRFGGRHSPGGPTPAGAQRPAATPAFRGRAAARVSVRARSMYILPMPLLFAGLGAIGRGAAGEMLAEIGGFVGLMLSAWLLNEGLRAEAAFEARKVARPPALPRKLVAAALTGVAIAGLGVASLGQGVFGAAAFGVVAALAQLAAFGLDPMRGKGLEGANAFESERVARAIDAAEALVRDTADAARRLTDRRLVGRVERLCDQAREVFRTIEADPRDLARSRVFLNVYLRGLRDATVKLADLQGRGRDPDAQARYEALLGDLEASFATQRTHLLEESLRPGGRDRGAARTAATRRARRPLTPDRRKPMSDDVRAKAEASLTEVQAVTAALLPEPRADAAKIAADPAARGEIERRKAEIDLSSSQSIIRFGSAAQAELQAISQDMLAGVRNKDIGPAGDSLREIVSSIRGFSVDELDPNRKRSIWERLTGSAKPVAEFMARYEEVQGQIDRITGELLGHEHALLKDIKSLDLLYGKTLAFYDELALYIAAGEAKLAELDATDIPAKAAEVQAAPEDQGVMKAQELRDLRSARDDLERRVHDLKLTRQVTMQSLPSIRLVQENDKSLVTKINSTLVNTVPLWETQLAQAVTIHRSRDAAKVVREANDLTNELLTKNAENLRQANKEIRTEMERGVFDIEAIEKANADLIGTIQESLEIADAGKARRAAAEESLVKMENELKAALAAASARATGLGSQMGGSVRS